MKKIITLLMCFVCCAAFAFVYESGGSRYLEEGYGSSGFGSGSGSEHDGPDYPTGTERIVYFLDPNDDSDVLYEEKHSDGFVIDLTLPKYQAVASPKTPTHYHYDGWTDTDSEPVTQITLNGSDITLYAKWSKNRTNIFFIDDSGTTKQTYEYNDVVVAPEPTERVGYTASWDSNLPAVIADANNKDFDSIYVNAVYTINTWALYKVVNGVTTKVSDVAYNTVITSSILPDPSVTGYTFVGWQNFPSDGKMPNNDLTVIANLSINHHNVTWIYQDADGNSHTLLPEEGTEYSSANVAYNTSLVQPTISLPSGYTMEWTYGGQSIIGMTMPDSDITITGEAVRGAYEFNINLTNNVVTYAGINTHYDAMSYDEATDVVSDGSWGDFINEIFTPVMLKSDGTVDYELSRTNQNYRADGVTPSDIANTSYDGNAMVRIKKMYSCITETTNNINVKLSSVKINNNYSAVGFIDAAGDEVDYVYYSMFVSSNPSGSKMRSLAGQLPATANASNARTMSASNGRGWNIEYLSINKFLATVLCMVSKATVPTIWGWGDNATNPVAFIQGSSLGSGNVHAGTFFNTASGSGKNNRTLWIESYIGYYPSCFWINGLLGGNATNRTFKYKTSEPYNDPSLYTVSRDGMMYIYSAGTGTHTHTDTFTVIDNMIFPTRSSSFATDKDLFNVAFAQNMSENASGFKRNNATAMGGATGNIWGDIILGRSSWDNNAIYSRLTYVPQPATFLSSPSPSLMMSAPRRQTSEEPEYEEPIIASESEEIQ